MGPLGVSELVSVLEDTIGSRCPMIAPLKLDEDKYKLGTYLSTRQL